MTRARRAAGPVEHDDVIVTSVMPYGESDLVVRLITRTRGRVGAFARHARASRRRFPGLSAPALGRALFEERHGAELLHLQELDVEPALLALAHDLRGWGHAAYVVELVERLTPPAEPAPELFHLVRAALMTLASGGPSPVLLRAVELKLLRELGYLPDLADADGGALELSEEARRMATALLLAEDLAALPSVEHDVLRQVARIFAAHLRQHVSGPLRSVQFLASLEGASLAGSVRSR